MAGSGKRRKKKKTQFIVFCQPYKTPNGSKKKKEKKRIGFNSVVLLEALAQRFIWFGENDVRPRHFQRGPDRSPGEGRERVNGFD